MVTANQYKVLLIDHFYPIMEYGNADGNDLIQDDNDPMLRCQGELVSKSLYLSQLKHLWNCFGLTH